MAEGAHASQMKTALLTNRSYDILKFVALVLLPAFATLYFTLAMIWHLPKAEEVVGSIAAFTTFLGIFLRVSSKSYHDSDTKYDGELEIEEPENGPRQFNLILHAQPEELENRKEIRFRVPRK